MKAFSSLLHQKFNLPSNEVFFFFEAVVIISLKENYQRNRVGGTLKGTININRKNGCCFGVSMAGVVSPVSRGKLVIMCPANSWQKGDCALIGEETVSGSSVRRSQDERGDITGK